MRRIFMLPAAIALIVACEGDNLFNEDATDYRPRVIHLSVPSAAPGDTVWGRVDAQSLRGVSEVIVSAAGAVHLDTVVVVNPPQTSVTVAVPFVVPVAPSINDLFVQAQAIDIHGTSSRVAQVAATVDGPPNVLTASAQAVAPGQRVEIQVSAFGTRPVTSFDLRIRGAMHKDTTAVVVPARTDVLRLIRFDVPATATEPTMTVEIVARDDHERVSAPFNLTIPVSG